MIGRFDVSYNLDAISSGRYVLYSEHLVETEKLKDQFLALQLELLEKNTELKIEIAAHKEVNESLHKEIDRLKNSSEYTLYRDIAILQAENDRLSKEVKRLNALLVMQR